ncbi:MAG: SIMPL domain-containing protein [Verrucomicrobiota bacterium]|nr:SIMPL domain-containing protein [Verrucomicrobiota bacterium]
MTPARPHLFGLLAGLFLSTALVFSAFMVANTWTRISDSQTIGVTGSARKNIRSDLVVLRGSTAFEAPTLKEAQAGLRESIAKVEGFLKARSITSYELLPVRISQLYTTVQNEYDERTQRTVGFRLSQSWEIQSSAVTEIPKLASEAAELIDQGIAATWSDPEYIYTKAGEAKLEMLAEATKDARARAELIAGQGGRKLGALRSAKMGVFQITPLYSTDTSWDGMNDRTSLEKTISSTVQASFFTE